MFKAILTCIKEPHWTVTENLRYTLNFLKCAVKRSPISCSNNRRSVLYYTVVFLHAKPFGKLLHTHCNLTYKEPITVSCLVLQQQCSNAASKVQGHLTVTGCKIQNKVLSQKKLICEYMSEKILLFCHLSIKSLSSMTRYHYWRTVKVSRILNKNCRSCVFKNLLAYWQMAEQFIWIDTNLCG